VVAALGHFLEAIRLEPDRADLHFAAAMCEWAAGQMDNAGQYLQSAVRIDPKFATAQAVARRMVHESRDYRGGTKVDRDRDQSRSGKSRDNAGTRVGA